MGNLSRVQVEGSQLWGEGLKCQVLLPEYTASHLPCIRNAEQRNGQEPGLGASWLACESQLCFLRQMKGLVPQRPHL